MVEGEDNDYEMMHQVNSFSIYFSFMVNINPNSKYKNLNFNPHAGLAVITTEISFMKSFCSEDGQCSNVEARQGSKV